MASSDSSNSTSSAPSHSSAAAAAAASETKTQPSRPMRPRAMSSGTIKNFDSSQGQGWIRPSNGGKDVHFHLSNLQPKIKALFPGQKITFAVREEEEVETEGDEHPIAIDIEADDGHLEPRFLKLGH